VELADRLKEFVSQGKLVEAQRLEQRTRFDLEMLSELGHCKGIENYTRHLSGAAPGDPPATLTDYLPKDAVMFLDESHVLIGQFGGMYNGDRSRKTTLVEYGFRLPSALGQPAAEVRGIRGSHAPGDLSSPPRRRSGKTSMRGRSWSNWCGRPGWWTRKWRCDRPPTRSTTCCRKSGFVWIAMSAC
jgi:hypothetical protein